MVAAEARLVARYFGSLSKTAAQAYTTRATVAAPQAPADKYTHMFGGLRRLSSWSLGTSEKLPVADAQATQGTASVAAPESAAAHSQASHAAGDRLAMVALDANFCGLAASRLFPTTTAAVHVKTLARTTTLDRMQAFS